MANNVAPLRRGGLDTSVTELVRGYQLLMGRADGTGLAKLAVHAMAQFREAFPNG